MIGCPFVAGIRATAPVRHQPALAEMRPLDRSSGCFRKSGAWTDFVLIRRLGSRPAGWGQYAPSLSNVGTNSLIDKFNGIYCAGQWSAAGSRAASRQQAGQFGCVPARLGRSRMWRARRRPGQRIGHCRRRRTALQQSRRAPRRSANGGGNEPRHRTWWNNPGSQVVSHGT